MEEGQLEVMMRKWDAVTMGNGGSNDDDDVMTARTDDCSHDCVI